MRFFLNLVHSVGLVAIFLITEVTLALLTKFVAPLSDSETSMDSKECRDFLSETRGMKSDG